LQIKAQTYKNADGGLNDSINSESNELDVELNQKPAFKFTECTICLGMYVNGDSVKVVPGCSHVFHDSCFNDWVEQKWRCPNCNTEIIVEGMEDERRRYNMRVALINGSR